MVQVHPGPPVHFGFMSYVSLLLAVTVRRRRQKSKSGGLAQLVERLLCKQEVSGSNPLSSTSDRDTNNSVFKDLSCKDQELIFA